MYQCAGAMAGGGATLLTHPPDVVSCCIVVAPFLSFPFGCLFCNTLLQTMFQDSQESAVVEFVNSVAILSVFQLMSSDPADSNKVAAGARTTF